MNCEIKKVLARDKINFNKLFNMLLYDFDSYIDDFFRILMSYANNSKKTGKLSELIDFIGNNISSFDKEKIDVIAIKCLDLKEIVLDKDIIGKIDSLLNNIYYENTDEYKNNIGEFLRYLIFDDKAVKRIKIFLSSIDKSFFNSEQFENILEELFDKFNTKDREIKKYYYKVSIMLLKTTGNSLLAKNRKKYLSILDDLKVHSEYTDDLVDLVKGDYVSNDTFLSRFGISSSFPYSNSFNVINCDKDIPSLRQGAITIDKASTIKRDDAIFFKKNRDNTYTLYVHVSFVPSMVSYDSIVNREARRRYKSLCLFDNMVPMLSEDLCLNYYSLDRDVYRNVITYSIKIDRDMNIIPDSLKISRTNVKVLDNYDFELSDILIKNGNDDVSDMLRKLTVFSLKCSNDIDVDKALGDSNYFNSLLYDNVSMDMLFQVMRNINHCIAKYFKDRELPFLYKYSEFNDEKCNSFMNKYRDNASLVRYNELEDSFRSSFFEIKLSSEPKSFFEFDCYSSSTDPLWKYSSMYNQFIIDNFIFCKKDGTDLRDEWYNRTRALAKEMNKQKQESKDVQTVCKSLVKVRNKY